MGVFEMKKIFILFGALFFFSLLHCADITWSSTQILLSSGQNASDPQISIDSSGNAVAVWAENGFVLARSKPVSGGWGSTTTLSNSGASNPRLTVDPSGNATAIWVESGVVKAASQPFGGSWGSFTTLSSSGASSPQITGDPSGNVVAIWARNTIIESSTKLFGFSWPLPANVDVISSSGADSPQVSLGANGTVVATWHALLTSVNTIFYNTKTLSGGIWGSAQPISDPAHDSINHQIAVDPNGNAIAIWYRFDVSGVDYSNVILQWATKPVAGSWTFPADLSSPSIRNPLDLAGNLRFDDMGNLMAIWTSCFDGSTFNIETEIKPLNEGWSDFNLLLAQNLYSQKADHAVVVGGNVFAAFMFFDGTSLSIQTAEVDMAANRMIFWSVPINISSGTNNAFPKIAVSRSGNNLNGDVVWVKFNGTNNDIITVSGTGTVLLPPSNLTITQQLNDFGVIKDYSNVLNWTASPSSSTLGYVIYRDGVFIDRVGLSVLQYTDHNQLQGGPVTYHVSAFQPFSQSDPASVSLP